MGVNDLWQLISSEAKNNIPVSEWCGKTVAVDLSPWIVDSKSVKTPQGSNNWYLRTLFYRIIALMQANLKLVFVLDGIQVPGCKEETITKRRKQSPSKLSGVLRGPQFREIEEKCIELIEALGLPWIRAPGEAEAYCAGLHMDKMVDAVCTTDSDVLLYGARIVWKKLYQDQKIWKVDVFNMDDIEKKFRLDRDSLIAMAMLAGCDYNMKGIENVGTRKALELFEEIRHNTSENLLDRILKWRENEYLNKLVNEAEDNKHNPHCSFCHHSGTKQQHKKTGCHVCKTEATCIKKSKEKCTCGHLVHEKEEYKLELRVRAKALADSAKFPDTELVEEFKEGSKIRKTPALVWSSIKIPQLKRLNDAYLRFHLDDFYEKLAKFLFHMQLLAQPNETLESNKLHPVRIVKECRKNKENCLQVDCSATFGIHEINNTYTIVISRSLFSRHYPEMISKFEATNGKKRKCSGKKRKADKSENQNQIINFFPVQKKPSISSTLQKTSQ